MNSSLIQDQRKIRFIVANYPALQGLKFVPLGILLITVVLWIDWNPWGRMGTLLGLPMIALALSLSWLIERSYKRTFGNIQRTPRNRWLEILLMVAGGIAGLVAFGLDVWLHLPATLVGLVFAAAFLGDYILALYTIHERNFFIFPLPLIAALGTALLSLAPLLGLQWWQWFGFRNHWTGLYFALGVLIILWSVGCHAYLRRYLPPQPEQ